MTIIVNDIKAPFIKVKVIFTIATMIIKQLSRQNNHPIHKDESSMEGFAECKILTTSALSSILMSNKALQSSSSSSSSSSSHHCLIFINYIAPFLTLSSSETKVNSWPKQLEIYITTIHPHPPHHETLSHIKHQSSVNAENGNNKEM